MLPSPQTRPLRSYQWYWLLSASLLLLVITELVIAESVTAREPRDAEAEFENIRALPYGFHVQCEGKHLKIRKKGSATFIVRNSFTCIRFRVQVAEQYRDDFTLCSNDPTHMNTPPDRKVVKCISLKIGDDAI